VINLGDVTAGQTVYLPWNSNATDGSAVAPGAAGTLRIFKDNSNVQRTSASGITDTVSFDGIAGTNLITIDLSDNADAGFYAAGHDYFVMRPSMTIDGVTVSVFVGMFSIQNRVNASPGLRRNVAFSNFQFLMTDDVNHRPLAGLTNADFTAKEEDLDNTGFVTLSGTITEVSDGWYSIDLTSGEMNGHDISLRFAATGADTRNLTLITVS
jgi:hypothetical protein